MPDISSSWIVQDLNNTVLLTRSHRRTLTLYEIDIPDDVPVMHWYGFPLPITKEMVKILHRYDVYLIQILALIVLVYERLKFLEKTFFVKFGYEAMVSQINLVEDQGQRFPVSDVLFGHEHELTLLESHS